MKLDAKLREGDSGTMWREYLGFMDLSVDGYMDIQNRLMLEQLKGWCASGLGKQILGGAAAPETVEEFRRVVPLTTYEDYAETLLQKRDDLLPEPAVIWIKTTWEGGKHPIKVAPYTQGMLDTYRINMGACLMMFGATGRGRYTVGKRVLSGFAPLPYATGLMGLMLRQETDMRFLPPYEIGRDLSFSQQTKLGFKMALGEGMDYLFSMGSVAYCISRMLTDPDKKHRKGKLSPRVAWRYLRAKARCARENRPMLPKDLFDLTGLVCAGTDNACYKDDLEEMWGVRPLELFAGTEPTLIGVETWNKNGLYFFPDPCFYEFLPLEEAAKLKQDPEHRPVTVLMDGVLPGEKYELIISVLKGGAFARYRTGDVYCCEGVGSRDDQTRLPRFRYIDRMPDVIDIAGFTRITRDSIASVIDMSGLPIDGWFAAKEHDEAGHPFLHLYVEMRRGRAVNYALSSEILKEHLGIYFKYLDSDYKDLKKLLNMDPLEVTILISGAFERFEQVRGRRIAPINPPAQDIVDLLAFQGGAKPPEKFYTAGGDD